MLETPVRDFNQIMGRNWGKPEGQPDIQTAALVAINWATRLYEFAGAGVVTLELLAATKEMLTASDARFGELAKAYPELILVSSTEWHDADVRYEADSAAPSHPGGGWSDQDLEEASQRVAASQAEIEALEGRDDPTFGGYQADIPTLVVGFAQFEIEQRSGTDLSYRMIATGPDEALGASADKLVSTGAASLDGLVDEYFAAYGCAADPAARVLAARLGVSWQGTLANLMAAAGPMSADPVLNVPGDGDGPDGSGEWWADQWLLTQPPSYLVDSQEPF